MARLKLKKKKPPKVDYFEKFYNRTLRFLSFRPRSKKEITDFLKKPRRAGSRFAGKKVEPPLVNKILNKLKEVNLVNDQEFARWWIEQRTQSRRPKGLRLIKLELQHKGIDRETIEKILGNYDIKILSEDMMKRLVEKQYPKYAKLPKQEAYQKLSQFLLRRGFDWETIKTLIDEVLGK